MMQGSVNAILEATLPLQVFSPANQSHVTAVIDTGYNGSLTLPLETVTLLALPQLAARAVVLGDNSRRVLDFYEAEVLWNGQRRSVPILCVEGDPLIGTALLQGHEVVMQFAASGLVSIQALPASNAETRPSQSPITPL